MWNLWTVHFSDRIVMGMNEHAFHIFFGSFLLMASRNFLTIWMYTREGMAAFPKPRTVIAQKTVNMSLELLWSWTDSLSPNYKNTSNSTISSPATWWGKDMSSLVPMSDQSRLPIRLFFKSDVNYRITTLHKVRYHHLLYGIVTAAHLCSELKDFDCVSARIVSSTRWGFESLVTGRVTAGFLQCSFFSMFVSSSWEFLFNVL